MMISNCICDVEYREPSPEHIGAWEPPPDVFSEHEMQAILGPSPVVQTYKTITIQGFEFKTYSKHRRSDSSTAWAKTTDGPCLVRILSVVKTPPCTYKDCKSAVVVEVQRFTMGHNRVRNGPPVASMKPNTVAEYMYAACLLPQVVVLFPMIRAAPTSPAERTQARRIMLSGPFYVVDMKHKTYM